MVRVGRLSHNCEYLHSNWIGKVFAAWGHMVKCKDFDLWLGEYTKTPGMLRCVCEHDMKNYIFARTVSGMRMTSLT